MTEFERHHLARESVWDYPRPPRLEDFPGRIRVVFAGRTIVDTLRAKRVLETSHPPTYYVPPDDIAAGSLESTRANSWCEWKGRARYFDVVAGGRRAARAAWSYPHPTVAFAAIADYVAFYRSAMDACFVNDERVAAQPGDFYGGWITSNLIGPFKGGPETVGW